MGKSEPVWERPRASITKRSFGPQVAASTSCAPIMHFTAQPDSRHPSIQSQCGGFCLQVTVNVTNGALLAAVGLAQLCVDCFGFTLVGGGGITSHPSTLLVFGMRARGQPDEFSCLVAEVNWRNATQTCLYNPVLPSKTTIVSAATAAGGFVVVSIQLPGGGKETTTWPPLSASARGNNG